MSARCRDNARGWGCRCPQRLVLCRVDSAAAPSGDFESSSLFVHPRHDRYRPTAHPDAAVSSGDVELVAEVADPGRAEAWRLTAAGPRAMRRPNRRAEPPTSEP